MEQSQPTVPTLFGGRYEVTAREDDGRVEVLDREPWQRCWACGSQENQPGDAFCSNCGAALEPRRYTGTVSPTATPDALAIVASLQDPFARTVLPPIWESITEESYTLVLREPSGYSPVEVPLDDLLALHIGADMARLLGVLHDQGITLGKVDSADLGMTAEGSPRLLNVAGLQQLRNTEQQTHAAQADLRALAELLETLTATPRTTQRLDDGDEAEAEQQASTTGAALAALLSQLRTGQFDGVHDLVDRIDELIRERTRPLPLRQIVGTASNTGIVRDHNEDSLFASTLALNNSSHDYTRGLYIVADGMGGHAAGEVASCLAIRGAAELVLKEYLPHLLDPSASFDEEYALDVMHRATLQANEAVRSAGMAHGNDMGTTLTMALVIGDRAIIANVGDSRTYLYRKNKLQRITQDHSLVMRLVELGQLTEADIYTHPQRNAVLRSLGDTADLEVDLFVERLQPGDILFLCSDGQWEMTHDPEIERILSLHPDVQQASQELIQAANQAGGEDNITNILVRFAAFEL